MAIDCDAARLALKSWVTRMVPDPECEPDSSVTRVRISGEVRLRYSAMTSALLPQEVELRKLWTVRIDSQEYRQSGKDEKRHVVLRMNSTLPGCDLVSQLVPGRFPMRIDYKSVRG